nr:glycine oxidase [uncultured Gammaproteobacteria bacterium]
MKCLILGGGIMGLLCARELSASGWQVKIVDRSAIGQEASWAGGGILSPLYPWRQPEPIQQLTLGSGRDYAELVKELQSTGIHPELQQCGMLWLDLEDLSAACAWCRRHGIVFEILDRREIEKRFPGVRSTKEAFWVPGISQIRNPRLLKALKRDCQLHGVAFEEKTPVVGWRRRGTEIISAITPKGEIRADVFVVTAGAWSARWSKDLLWQPRIRPVKGQMLLVQAEPGILTTMVQHGEHYLIPRLDGRILIGSTVEEAGFDKRPTKEAYQGLYRFAIDTLPSLRHFPVELHWAGLRPAAPSGIPYIGRHPRFDNLYYNCGHFRNGVTMGPAATKLLSAWLLKQEPDFDPNPYLPENRL